MNRRLRAPEKGHPEIPTGMEIVQRVRQLRGEGRSVIDFMTRPDAPTRAKEAADRMLRSRESCFYADTRGWPALRCAIARKLERENGISADPDTEILVTSGAMGALSSTLLALVGPGDEVLVEDPCFHAFLPKIAIAGGTCVRMPQRTERGFRMDLDRLRECVSERTRLLFLCNPDNPTGRICTRQELEAVAEAAATFDFHVLVDEAYEKFTYDGRVHQSLASIVDDSTRIITVQSASKTFHMHGWRVGWIAAEPCVLGTIAATHASLVTCPATFAQAGVAAALEDGLGEGDVPIPEMLRRYQERRDAMVRGLNAIEGVQCAEPEGAYFVFPDFSAFGMSSVALSRRMLEAGGVSSTPGSAFGPNGEHCLRLNFNAPISELEEGLSRIGNVVSGLPARKSE